MNYLEIFNKVMLELNLRPIEQFENIYKNEHLRILENIRRVNSEVQTSHNWDFLLREDEIELDAGEFDSLYSPDGRVVVVYEGSNRLKFSTQFEKFLSDSNPEGDWGIFNSRLVFLKSQKARQFRVFYTTKNTAQNSFGEQIENFAAATDVSLIPEPFAGDILVYGACVKTKANPGFTKFGYWNANYIRALGRLRAESPHCRDDIPTIRIMRRI